MPDFYDAFKLTAGPEPVVGAPVNGPVNGTINGPVNGTSHNGSLHPYARAIRDAWLTRLDDLPRPWVQGACWDTNAFVAARKLIEVANSPWAGYRLTDAHADYHAHAPYDQVWDKRDKKWQQALTYSGRNALPEPAPGPLPPVVTILETPLDLDPDHEAEFWGSRRILAHLHDYARARRVSPWAVLAVALARIITATPPAVCLPPIVGGRASLNIFIGLVGPSGSGKGAAEVVAAEAVHVGPIVSHNVGSGEGIAHGYAHRERGVLVRHEDAILFSVPEIDSLAAQGFGRQGATLMPQLRSGWTGEQLGFGYADPKKRIIVEAHTYRLCMVAGIQPGRAGCLLGDVDGGTPQRFLWMPSTDPAAPDQPAEEPRPHTWTPPAQPRFSAVGGHHVQVCQSARDAVDAARLGRLRGNTGAVLDGHELLARLKAAAALGIAEGRYTVDEEDWELAGTILAKSTATRTLVEEGLRARAAETNHARAEADARRAVIVTERLDDAAVKRVCKAVLRRLPEGEWVSGGKLRKSLTSGDRRYCSEALDRLLDTAQVEGSEEPRGRRYRRVT
jgi:hypothetical protein